MFALIVFRQVCWVKFCAIFLFVYLTRIKRYWKHNYEVSGKRNRKKKSTVNQIQLITVSQLRCITENARCIHEYHSDCISISGTLAEAVLFVDVGKASTRYAPTGPRTMHISWGVPRVRNTFLTSNFGESAQN